MRILMLTDLYPPLIGGLEQHVRNLSGALVARRHAVAVVTLQQEGLATFEIDQGARVYRVPGTAQRLGALFSDGGRRFASPLPDPETMLALREIIRRERPEIIHGHNWLIHSALPLKRWSGAKLVASLHEYSLACARKDLAYRGTVCDGPALGKCLSCASAHYGKAKGIPTALATAAMGDIERRTVDMFLPVSQAVAAGNGLVGGRAPYRVIPNFIPDDVAATSDETAECLADLPADGFLLFVGALNRHKGVEPLLRAYSELRDAPPLVLIGSTWPDTPKAFPANAIVLKNWTQRAVMAAWQRCSIGIVPSVWPEPWGAVAMEAMMVGKPVVASRTGGLADIVAHERTGLLVPPGDVAALRDALQTLIDDPAKRAAFGEAGRRRVQERFTTSVVVPEIEGVYRDLLNGTSRRMLPVVGTAATAATPRERDKVA